MILEQIQKELLKVRKEATNKNKIAFLTTLYSESAIVGKNNGNRLSTDDEVQKVLNKFKLGANENIGHYLMRGDEESLVKVEALRKEVEIIESFLPTQLTNLELEKIIAKILESVEERTPKAIGIVSNKLKVEYAGQYDSATASKITKNILGL